MKNKRRRFYNIAIVCLVVIESIFIYLSYRSFGNKEMILDEVNLTAGKPVEKDNLFAFMIEQENGEYVKSDLDTWPTDMVFNAAKSGCIDADGNTIEGALVFDNTTHMATLTTNATAYCYLYFSIDMAFTFYLGGSDNPSHTSSTETPVYLNWDATDVVEYCVTNTIGTDNCTWKTVSSKPTTGIHTLTSGDDVKIAYAYLKDEDGAISKRVPDRIILDTTIPVVTSLTNTGYGFDYISVQVSGADESGGIAKFYYKIGDGDYVASTTNSYKFSGLTHGNSYDVSVYIEDVAGNKSAVVTNTYSTKSNGLGTAIEAGMYRYQGTDAMNYVCFGTTVKSECVGKTDAYMYRIIGIRPNGQMKLIKKEALNSTVKWWSDYTTDVTWPNSLIYTTINGNEFLLSETYVPTGWESKIATTSWYYGDTTNSGSYKGETMYPIENPFGESTASNRFTNTVSAKIGLMYIHDYYYAYASGGAPGSYSNAKTAWIHMSKNDSGAPSSYEWTMSRYGLSGSNYFAWIVYSDGNVNYRYLSFAYSVRPVFYLTSDVEIIGGTGTIDDPFLIS